MEKVISYSYARQNLSAVLDEVIDHSEVICIQRKDGKKAVLVEEDNYNSLLETSYLLRSPANAKQLLKALEEAKQGQGVEVEF